MNNNTAILHRLQGEVMQRLEIINKDAKQPRRFYHLDLISCLPDRQCFEQSIRRHLQTTTSPTGLLLIDIDHLKLINDTKGQNVGDRVIADVASRLRNICKNATAFRLNNDEFALLVYDCRSQPHLDAVADDVLTAMAKPLAGFADVLPRVTIGGALIGNVYLDPGILRRNANLALCHAKDTMRGGYVAFDRRVRESSTRRMRSLGLVETALVLETLVPHYQPVVNLCTSNVVGVEALARIVDNTGHVTEAESFHSALQDPSVSTRATDRILRQVAKDVGSWLDAGLLFQHVGINLSMADLSGCDLSDRLSRIFGEQGVPLSHLVLEVTETVYLDGDGNGIAAKTEKLRDLGLLVALDDFGTGYASLKHLQSFPVDIVKIDKSFVRGLPSQHSSAVIVEGLIGIAERMGMKVVAEGIETPDQAEFLKQIGCTLGQGYLFGMPAPADCTGSLMIHAPSVVPAVEALARC